MPASRTVTMIIEHDQPYAIPVVMMAVVIAMMSPGYMAIVVVIRDDDPVATPKYMSTSGVVAMSRKNNNPRPAPVVVMAQIRANVMILDVIHSPPRSEIVPVNRNVLGIATARRDRNTTQQDYENSTHDLTLPFACPTEHTATAWFDRSDTPALAPGGEKWRNLSTIGLRKPKSDWAGLSPGKTAGAL